MNNTTQNTTKEAAISSASAGAATTRTLSIGVINRRIQKLNAALERRKQVEPLLTDHQREEFKGRFAGILKNPGPIAWERLRWFCDTAVYLAVTENFKEFCNHFLGIDDETINRLLAERPTKDAGEVSSAGVSISNQENAHPDQPAGTPQASPSAAPMTAAGSSCRDLVKSDGQTSAEDVAVPKRAKNASRNVRRKKAPDARAPEPTSITPPASPAELATATDTQPLVLVPVPGDEVLPVTTRAYWSGRINSRLTTGVAWIAEAGKDLLQAKESLRHGEFKKMFTESEVKISLRSAQMLMKIAGNGVLSKTNNFSRLPPTVAVLYLLSGVKETKLQHGIDSGLISPSMKICDARALVPKSPARLNAGKTSDPVVVAPTYTESDLETAFGRAVKILDKELHGSPDDKSRLRLCQMLVSHLLTKMMSIHKQKPA